MNDFPPSVSGYRSHPTAADNRTIDSDQRSIYEGRDNPNEIVTHAPRERFRLGGFDVACLVINWMIGEF